MNIPSFPPQTTEDPSRQGAAGGFLSQAGSDSFVSILNIFKSRRWTILGVAVLIMALSVLIISRITPVYSASASILIEEDGARIVDLDAVVSGVTTDPSSLRNQIEIIQSRSMAERVVRNLGLLTDPEFAGDTVTALPVADGGEAELATDHPHVRRVVSRLINRLEVDIIGGSVLSVTLSSESPEKAASLANAFAEAYLYDQLTTRFEATQRATTWLAGRLGALSDDVREAEQAVERYKVEKGITEANGTTLVTQQVAELNSSLVAARTARAQEEVKLRRIEQVARQGGNLETVSQVVGSPLIASLRSKETEAQRRKAELSTRYGVEHPQMINVDAEIADIRNRIRAEISRVVELVRSDVAVARAKERSLQQSLNEVETRLQDQNKSRIELRNLEAVAETKRAIYDNFVNKISEAEEQEGLDTENARILSNAIPPNSPSYPNKPLLYAVALIGALGVGVIVALALDALDAGFRTEAQAESVLRLPVLSTIPEITGKEKKDGLQARMVVDKPLSGFSESVRSIQSALSLSNVDTPHKVVLLTSSMPKEGKTTLSINLARHHATRERKVLLIDADLRHPSVGKTLEIESKSGLVEILAGDATFEESIVKDPLTDMDVLPVHQRAANPSHLFDSESIRKLIDGLRDKYDYIIIDSAPILPVNDTKFLSKAVDAMIFVVRWESTTRDAAREGVKRLRDIDAPLVGSVFSRADSRRYAVYSYGYGYRYGDSTKYYQ